MVTVSLRLEEELTYAEFLNVPGFLTGPFLMKGGNHMAEESINQAMEEEEAEVCTSCGNIYRIELLKEGEDYNDFGYRHCPFCGTLIDLYA
jgi:predicted RNA-binding Zn-ribbon protein involved in translation (DUF1610 family)